MKQDDHAKNGNALNGVLSQESLVRPANTDNLFDVAKKNNEDFSVTFDRAVNNVSHYSARVNGAVAVAVPVTKPER